MAKGLKKACPCVKVGVAVLGLEVPHAHIHLVPMQTEADLNFHHHIKMEPAKMQELAKKIADAIQ